MTSTTVPIPADTRPPTAIDAIAERWVDTVVELEPVLGTYIGRSEVNDRYGDLSPAGHERYIAAVKGVLAELAQATPVDEVDEVTKTDLRNELELAVASSEAGLQLRDLNVIDSPSQHIREVYDLMLTA